MLRFLQGFFAGGEWGSGAVITMETAPKQKRGILSGFLQSDFNSLVERFSESLFRLILPNLCPVLSTSRLPSILIFLIFDMDWMFGAIRMNAFSIFMFIIFMTWMFLMFFIITVTRFCHTEIKKIFYKSLIIIFTTNFDCSNIIIAKKSDNDSFMNRYTILSQQILCSDSR